MVTDMPTTVASTATISTAWPKTPDIRAPNNGTSDDLIVSGKSRE